MEPDKNIVLLSGNINSQEMDDIQALFPEYDVSLKKTKWLNFDNNFVQVVFQDFTVLDFARDMILSEILRESFIGLKKLTLILNKEKRPVDRISYEIDIRDRSKKFTLNINYEEADYDLIMSLVDKRINDIADRASQNSLMQVRLDDKKIDIEINKF